MLFLSACRNGRMWGCSTGWDQSTDAERKGGVEEGESMAQDQETEQSKKEKVKHLDAEGKQLLQVL